MSTDENHATNIPGIILFCFPIAAFKYYALLILKELGESHNHEQIWEKTIEQQKRLALKRPRYSPGTNHLVRYMEWDYALYLALQEQGVAHFLIGEIIEKINWAIFGPAIKAVSSLSHFRSKRLLTRIEWIVDLMFQFMFTAPFQRHKHSRPNKVAFDVLVCPLAKYFNEQNIPALTSSAACSLDYHMADLWGVTLSRSQTIAQGYPHCDFCFHTNPVRIESL